MHAAIRLVVAAGLLLASDGSHPVLARLIAAEDFDYDGATLTAGLNGGFGWSEGWTGENFVTVGSLEFGGILKRGHKLTTNPFQGREATKCSYRAISATGNDDLVEDGKFGRDNTVLWIGFLVNAPTGLSTGYGGLSLYDDEKQQVFLGDTGASDVYAIERSGQLQRFSTVRADGVVHFVVCRMTFRPGEDQIDMWIDPAPGSQEPAEAAAAASATVRDFRFNRVRLCSAPVPLNFDMIRLGTAFGDLAATGPKSTSMAQSLTVRSFNWMSFLVICSIMAMTGFLLLAILFWSFLRRRRREPPLVR